MYQSSLGKIEGKNSHTIQSGVFVLCGKPGSGKTTTATKIIQGKFPVIPEFDFYLVLSPTMMPGVEFSDEFRCDTVDLKWLA